MTRNHPINVQPLTGAIGARVTGVDLSQELDAETFAAIQQALNEYLVLAFSDQDLTPAEQSRFSKLFGPAEPHPYGARVGVNNENPEVIVLETKPGPAGGRATISGIRISRPRKNRRRCRCCMRGSCPKGAAIRCSATCTGRSKPCPRPCSKLCAAWMPCIRLMRSGNEIWRSRIRTRRKFPPA